MLSRIYRADLVPCDHARVLCSGLLTEPDPELSEQAAKSVPCWESVGACWVSGEGVAPDSVISLGLF